MKFMGCAAYIKQKDQTTLALSIIPFAIEAASQDEARGAALRAFEKAIGKRTVLLTSVRVEPMPAVPTTARIATLVHRCRKEGKRGPWQGLIDALAARARHEREIDLLAFNLADLLFSQGHHGVREDCFSCDLVRRAQELGVLKWPSIKPRQRKP